MLATAWRWFYRSVLCIAAIWVLLTLYIVVGMSRATVQESADWIKIPSNEVPRTLSTTLPGSATRYRFASSSIGMGGRFMAYAVDGKLADLHSFAESELESHWDKPGFAVERNTQSPFDPEYISFLRNAYSTDLAWLEKSSGAIGSVYRGAKRQGSHVPLVFVDEENGMLYFVMTD